MKVIPTLPFGVLDPYKDQIAFAADHHIGHRNIIKYSNRPFDSVRQMDETILVRHNQACDNDTIVFFMGDIANPSRDADSTYYRKLEDYLKEFRGKIYYIAGNHEQMWRHIALPWTILPQLTEISVLDRETEQGRRGIVLCHYALRTWNKAHHGSWHLYGHSHGGLKNDFGNSMQDYEYTLSMDVGVDCNDYYPFHYEDIAARLDKKTFRPIDHHSNRMEK